LSYETAHATDQLPGSLKVDRLRSRNGHPIRSNEVKRLKSLLSIIALLAAIALLLFFVAGPQWIDRLSNRIEGDPGRAPSAATLALHQQLIVGDLHADSALWGKDLMARNDWGQVDLQRLIEGGGRTTNVHHGDQISTRAEL